uniref:Inositol 1,4,5-triphosphate receptor associated 2 n=1 Tax=Paramormyrops kingsleyae TaxID=1676925 RepID=A0A3B3S127_9TELE
TSFLGLAHESLALFSVSARSLSLLVSLLVFLYFSLASPELVAGRGDSSPVTSIYRGPLHPAENRAVTADTEFHRLSLGFKCDMFTLEKRLRLEERSRDLAEDNMKREVSSCQGLLLALLPLCSDDNQSMEIIQRLGKNLDILIQSMSRVSTRSEMLGAIHQESRVSKVVEVMIQHVENLRRMYTKEHAELMELKETLIQNERSFGSLERGNSAPSTRRVSIAVIPRNSGGPANFDMHSRFFPSSFPSLQPLCWCEGWHRWRWLLCDSCALGVVLPLTHPSSSSLTHHHPMTVPHTQIFLFPVRPDQTSPSLVASHPVVPKGGRSLWLSVAVAVLLAGLLALLASVALQPAVDAAPVGPGDSWVTIQQFLWPYTGLRHNGQPPV